LNESARRRLGHGNAACRDFSIACGAAGRRAIACTASLPSIDLMSERSVA
jgi:hypothetical protein